MNNPLAAVVTKVTGHPVSIRQLADLRYLDDTISRGDWQFCRIAPSEIKNLVGKTRRIFISEPGGTIVRLAPEVPLIRCADGILRERPTGLISAAYGSYLEQLQAQGKTLYQRIVVGVQELRDDHGYVLGRERGSVIPLTWTAKVKAQELGWTEDMSSMAGRPLLSRLLRESVRPHTLARRAVKTLASSKKVGRTLVGHNLVLAPNPRLLAQIKRTGQAVDKVLEAAARKALEKMERKLGAKIIAVASTHLQDSSGVRPHLHVRMSAYDSAGKYVRLFDRAKGSSAGNRCLLQADVEMEIGRIIERWEPRSRD